MEKRLRKKVDRESETEEGESNKDREMERGRGACSAVTISALQCTI